MPTPWTSSPGRPSETVGVVKKLLENPKIHENPSMYLSSFPSEQRYMLEVNSNEQNTIKTRKGLVRFSSKVAPTMFTVPGARQHSSGTFCFKDFAKQECKMGVEPQETAHWTEEE